MMFGGAKMPLSILLILLPTLTWSLYEDQVGRFDWRHQYIGQVRFVEFDQSSSTSHAGGKRILVGTDQHVIASLNARSGDIGWRQVFEQSRAGSIDDFIHVGNYLVVVTGGGLFVRCFNPTRGNLIWEETVEDDASHVRASLHIVNDDTLMILTRSKLSVRNLSDGAVQWELNLPNSEVVAYQFLYERDGEVTAVGMAANSHVALVTCKDGMQKDSISVPAAWIAMDTSCKVVSEHLVCLSGQGATLQLLPLTAAATTTTAAATFRTTLLQDLGLSSHQMSLVTFQPSPETAQVFGVRLSDQHVAILAIDGNNVKVLKSMPGASTAQLTRYGDKTVVISLSRVDGGLLELRTYDLWTGDELADLSLTINFPSHHGLPQHLYSLVFRKKDGSSGVRALVLSEDHSVALLQQSDCRKHKKCKVAWAREEALASIVSGEMVDLPVSQIQQEMEDEFGQPDGGQYDILAMFVRRFSSQLAQLKTLFHQLKNKLKVPRHSHSHMGDADMEEDDDGDEDDEDWLTRDEFNLHKMVLATTSAGKLYGLDSLTGLPVWQYLLPDLRPFHRFGVETLPLFVQRTTAHFPHLPQCTVIGKHRVTGQGLLFSFNPIAGTPTDEMPPSGQTLNFQVLQMMMVSSMDDHFLRPLLILDKQLQFHVYPESGTRFVEELGSSVYMFTTDVEAGMLRGYGMTHGHMHTLQAQELWAVNLQKDTQVITSVVAKRTLEQVHSQGIVLGDRSVLYKYLNPNLVVVTAEGSEPNQKGTSTFINVYLIDAVSGHIVFHCNHKRSKGPVHVVHSENWVLYNSWNQKSRRNEIAVLELYEGQKQSNATAFSSLTPPPPPLVMRQSYIFPGYISHMAATLTEKGITSKHVLIALESGGVLEMPKALLDPRRPIIPTQENKEEGMIPYIPELPRPFEAIINYNQSVLNVRGISTAPAGLESTSLVVCYGLDMFGTRVMPSKMFDVLKEDFDYLFISLVLIGMIALSVISQKLAARKALKRAWR